MQWSDIRFNPTTRVLRQFAGAWLVFFGGLAIWHGLVKQNAALGAALGVLALVIGIAGLVRPTLVRWPYVGASLVAFPIGWVVSRVAAAILFFGLFTPIAVLFRWMGRDALALRKRPDQATYWTPKPAAQSAQDYFRQF